MICGTLLLHSYLVPRVQDYKPPTSGSHELGCSSDFYSWTLSKVVRSWTSKKALCMKATQETNMRSDTQNPLKNPDALA